MSRTVSLDYPALFNLSAIHRNLPMTALVEKSLARKEGILAADGALLVQSKNLRTGRSPKDKFIVQTPGTEDIWWGEVNRPIGQEAWHRLMTYARCFLQGREVFMFEGYAGADPAYRLQVRVVTEKAWQALFAHTLFIPAQPKDVLKPTPDFTVIAVPTLQAPEFQDIGLSSGVFILVNFQERIILIGGTPYGGEIKKSIFSILNYLLPKQDVFPMHCSANVDKDGRTALFFGLSGTGKTTLSADPERRLIGDDEHGWSHRGIFNFEGGCYAKCINLSREAEPQIFDAIRFGSILENVLLDDLRNPDFADDSITENTRATYPVSHIDNCVQEGVGTHPTDIFFLAADAFGVLPPIARLTPEQAMYHFLSGYTAKLAGTEAGINKPTATFSACFGAPFMVLHPFHYAEMLGARMRAHGTKLWLVNTGWTGGEYGTGQRMKISHTRTLLRSALTGKLNDVAFSPDPVFGVEVPQICPGVPEGILNPRNTWWDKDAYDRTARDLAERFHKNFTHFAERASPQVREAGPRID